MRLAGIAGSLWCHPSPSTAPPGRGPSPMSRLLELSQRSPQPLGQPVDEIPPEPPLLQAEQPQLPASHNRRGAPVPWASWWPSTGLFPVCPGLPFTGDPDLGTAHQVRPRQCWAEGNDHLSWPAGDALPNAAKNTTGLLGSKGTLLTRVQFGVRQDPRVLFCWTPWDVCQPKQRL